MDRKLEKLRLATKKTLYTKKQETPRIKKMRFGYRDRVLRIDPRNLVFIDESGINLGMTRLRGRSLLAERLYDSCPRNRLFSSDIQKACEILNWSKKRRYLRLK